MINLEIINKLKRGTLLFICNKCKYEWECNVEIPLNLKIVGRLLIEETCPNCDDKV